MVSPGYRECLRPPYITLGSCLKIKQTKKPLGDTLYIRTLKISAATHVSCKTENLLNFLLILLLYYSISVSLFRTWIWAQYTQSKNFNYLLHFKLVNYILKILLLFHYRQINIILDSWELFSINSTRKKIRMFLLGLTSCTHNQWHCSVWWRPNIEWPTS